MGNEKENVLKQIEQLEEISKEINHVEYDMLFEKMKSSLNTEEYLVSVMGQFSAGKSRLINNLLQREILPVHSTETTAIITILKYAEDERAVLQYDDGTEKIISIDEVAAFWTDNNLSCNIQNITVYLTADLLKQGLVIADTPGVNTVIEKHVELASFIMSLSDKVIYVMGKPATESDLKFMSRIKNAGLSNLIVRTHMDCIHISEEDIEETISKELSILQPLTDNSIYFVSNEEEDAFYMHIARLRDYLQQGMAYNIKELLISSCQKHISKIAEEYLDDIKNQIASLESYIEDSEVKLQEEKQELENAVSQLTNILRTNKEIAEKRIEAKYNEANKMLEDMFENAKSKANREYQEKQCDSSEDYLNQMKKIISENYENITKNYLSYLDEFLGDSKNELIRTLKAYNISEEFVDSLSIDNEEVSDKAQEFLRKIQVLELAKKDLQEKLDESKMCRSEGNSENISELQEIERQLTVVEEELKQYPEYETRYVVLQEQSTQASQTMKTIGNLLDWATILIPGKVYTTAGAELAKVGGKVASKIPHGVKVSEKLMKTAGILEKSEKAVEIATKIDAAGDVLKAARKITDKDNTVVGEKEKGVLRKALDLVSFEYYFEQIGKSMDQEEILAVDRVYEAKYKEGKKKIQEKRARLLEEKLRKMRQVSPSAVTPEYENQEMALNMKKIQQEIDELESELEKEKKQDKQEKLRDAYIEQLLKEMDILKKVINEEMGKRLQKMKDDYIMASSGEIIEKINIKRNQLAEIEKCVEEGDIDSIKGKLEKIEKQKALLERMIN